jgi:hypothetical protein
MTLIRALKTWDITTLPFTEILSWDLRKKGKHKKTVNDAWVVELRGYRIVEKRIFTVSHAAFPFGCGWQSMLQSPVMLRSSLNPLGLTTSSDTLGGEELSQVPVLRLTPSIRVRTSKLKWSSAQSGMTFSWKDRTGWIHKITCKIKTTWLGSEQHQAGYWINLVNTKALLERNGYRGALCEPTTMWLKGRYKSRSTLGWEWMICRCYLGKSSKDSNNEERLPLINLREAVSSSAKMWLVVATRLQGQHPPFRLCTSSNMPSVPTNVAYVSFRRFWEGMCFPSCNFCLKSRLGELAPFKTRLQFGWAQQPVRTNPWLSFTSKEQVIMGKLARNMTGVFRHDIAMSG